MPFMKKRMEEDEPPAERVERNDRIVREVRERVEPDYTETSEMEQEPEPVRHKAAPQKPTDLVNLKISIDELRLDFAAHMAYVNATAAAMQRIGMPEPASTTMVQSICAGNIQRIREIEAVLKQYGN